MICRAFLILSCSLTAALCTPPELTAQRKRPSQKQDLPDSDGKPARMSR